MPLWEKIKKYRRRIRFLSDAKRAAASVYEHKKEYAVLIRGTKNYLKQKGSALQKGKIKWHR